MSGRAARGVVERVYVTGELILETPTHFGNGDADGPTDMPLLRDPLDGRSPLLTGSSIAGALRHYLREFEHGYNVSEKRQGLAEALFGKAVEEATYQSWLMIDDALGNCPGVELRDGVSIDTATRTAMDNRKFDFELLRAGTTFELSIELLLTDRNEDLITGLALALRGFERGEIGMGSRKRRGMGQCRVNRWRVRRYRVTTSQGLLDWLSGERGNEVEGEEIIKLLDVRQNQVDRRETFTIEAAFGLETSLLIRSSSGEGDSPDILHLMSYRPDGIKSIISGTSLAGAVRARALRIVNTLLPKRSEALVDSMFGKLIRSSTDKPMGSRVVTRESILEGIHDRVQSRIKINRFTGGAFPGALFSEQPVLGGEGTAVTLHIELRQPAGAEVGLLLLVLKDLWTGDLPLGGESGIGRGRLTGMHATLSWKTGGRLEKEWCLNQISGRLEVTGSGTKEDLESFVEVLQEYGRAA